jgi:hypothetical protein
MRSNPHLPEWLETYFRHRPGTMVAVLIALCALAALAVFIDQEQLVLYQAF